MSDKRETRGRKPLALDKKKPPQATVKINSFILPFVKQLKGNLKLNLVSDNTLFLLFDVLDGKSEQQPSLFKDPETISLVNELQAKITLLEAEKRIIDTKLKDREKFNLATIQERDKERLNVISANSKLESLKSSYRILKLNYDELGHKIYDCMAVKANGDRCTKPSKIDFEQNGIMIHVCLQHSKLLSNKKVT